MEGTRSGDAQMCDETNISAQAQYLKEKSGPARTNISRPQRTTASNDTCPATPGGTAPGRIHFSSVEPTRFSSAVKVVPFGPRGASNVAETRQQAVDDRHVADRRIAHVPIFDDVGNDVARFGLAGADALHDRQARTLGR